MEFFFETSWDFQRHPLISKVSTIVEAFEQWNKASEERFECMKANEEELNSIFIDIYGLQDELTPEVEDKYITVRKADLSRDIRSLFPMLLAVCLDDILLKRRISIRRWGFRKML